MTSETATIDAVLKLPFTSLFVLNPVVRVPLADWWRRPRHMMYLRRSGLSEGLAAPVLSTPEVQRRRVAAVEWSFRSVTVSVGSVSPATVPLSSLTELKPPPDLASIEHYFDGDVPARLGFLSLFAEGLHVSADRRGGCSIRRPGEAIDPHDENGLDPERQDEDLDELFRRMDTMDPFPGAWLPLRCQERYDLACNLLDGLMSYFIAKVPALASCMGGTAAATIAAELKSNGGRVESDLELSLGKDGQWSVTAMPKLSAAELPPADCR